MKIYLFSDYFYPETNAPALRCKDHSDKWSSMGRDVTVVTCNPNFPNGKIYKGYKNRLISKERIGKTKVVRLWSFFAKNDGFLFRVIDHISSAIMFFIFSLSIDRKSYVIGTSPQFLTIVSLHLAAFLKGWKFVPEIRDMWPEGIIFLKKETMLYKFLEFLEIRIYKAAHKIIVVTESFKESIINRAGIRKENIIVSYNGVNTNLSISKTSNNHFESIIGPKDQKNICWLCRYTWNKSWA